MLVVFSPTQRWRGGGGRGFESCDQRGGGGGLKLEDVADTSDCTRGKLSFRVPMHPEQNGILVLKDE